MARPKRRADKKLAARIERYEADLKVGQQYDIHKPGSQNRNK